MKEEVEEFGLGDEGASSGTPNSKWWRRLRAAIRFLIHPRVGVLAALIALGIGVGFFLAAPLLLPAAAPILAIITIVSFSWAVVCLVPYLARFINGLQIDKQAVDLDKDSKSSFLGILIARFFEWWSTHPYQRIAVLIGILGLGVTLFFTISFFTGGAGAFVIPVILAPLGGLIAPAIPLLLFNLLPLALANAVKGIMAVTTSSDLEPDTSRLAWRVINEKESYLFNTEDRSLANMLSHVNVNKPESRQFKAVIFAGEPKLHKDPAAPLEDAPAYQSEL